MIVTPGPVNLDVRVPRFSRFRGWGSACTGLAPACTVNVTADTNVSSQIDRYNVAFLSSRQVPPPFAQGIAGADAMCTQLAAAAGLPDGGYRAWLSDAAHDPLSTFGGLHGWVLPNDEPFADKLTDLAAGRFWSLPNIFEDGGRLPADPQPVIFGDPNASYAVWTATGSDGHEVPDGGSAAACVNWQNGAHLAVVAGSPDSIGSSWTQAFSGSSNSAHCDLDGGLRLYCLGIGAPGATLAAPKIPPGGRHAFVSSTMLFGNQADAVADTVCNNEADDAGLGRNFQVMRATIGQTPFARFNLDGGAWYRPDGVALAATATALATAPYPSQPLALHVSGDLVVQGPPSEVWTGTLDPRDGGTAATTCNGWSSTSGTAYQGVTLGANPLFWGGFALSCAQQFSVACFEK